LEGHIVIKQPLLLLGYALHFLAALDWIATME
jgi:hypothetical protein